MSEQQKARELLAAARQYAEMAMSDFFDCSGLDKDAIEKLHHDLQAWFLFPNLPPEERALLSRLGYAAAQLAEAQSLEGTEMAREHKERVQSNWKVLKDDFLYSGVMDSLTPLQREIVQRDYVALVQSG